MQVVVLLRLVEMVFLPEPKLVALDLDLLILQEHVLLLVLLLPQLGILLPLAVLDMVHIIVPVVMAEHCNDLRVYNLILVRPTIFSL